MVIFKNFFGTTQQSEIMTNPLDLATAAAGFASNPSEIAPLVHEMQAIAARLKSGSLLTSEDEVALFDIYLKIEHYLTTSDPIRTFGRTELRSKASRGLRARLEAYENQATFKKQPIEA